MRQLARWYFECHSGAHAKHASPESRNVHVFIWIPGPRYCASRNDEEANLRPRPLQRADAVGERERRFPAARWCGIRCTRPAIGARGRLIDDLLDRRVLAFEIGGKAYDFRRNVVDALAQQRALDALVRPIRLGLLLQRLDLALQAVAILPELCDRAFVHGFFGFQRLDGRVVGAAGIFDLAVKRERLVAACVEAAAEFDQFGLALREARGEFGLALRGKLRLAARFGFEIDDVFGERFGLRFSRVRELFHLAQSARERLDLAALVDQRTRGTVGGIALLDDALFGG